MTKHKYRTFYTRADVCNWLDGGAYKSIVGITESDGCYTIFYAEYDEEAFIRDMDALSCDPDFLKPVRSVPPVGFPSTHRPNAVPEPATIC